MGPQSTPSQLLTWLIIAPIFSLNPESETINKTNKNTSTINIGTIFFFIPLSLPKGGLLKPNLVNPMLTPRIYRCKPNAKEKSPLTDSPEANGATYESGMYTIETDRLLCKKGLLRYLLLCLLKEYRLIVPQILWKAHYMLSPLALFLF
jgi:hypothetical protein